MMKLRVVVFVLFVAALSVPVCGAQGEKKKDETSWPDMSGEWTLDRGRSDKHAQDMTMTVVHRGPEIKVRKRLAQDGREWVEECVYYTDGRKEQKGAAGCYDSASLSARWHGQKLVRRGWYTTKGAMKLDMRTIEEWELSPDGKTLTRTVTNSQALSVGTTIVPRMRTRYVYTRGS